MVCGDDDVSGGQRNSFRLKTRPLTLQCTASKYDDA